MLFPRDLMCCLSSWSSAGQGGQRTRANRESTAQANAEGPGPNNLALSELQAVWTGKQKLCQDLQKAEDFSSELASRNAH